MKRQNGFTLIELMIAVVVIGILAAIAIPNFMRMRQNSVRASCVSNQRNILQGATLYAIEQALTSGSVNVALLESLAYISHSACECPASTSKDFDDYTVVITSSRPSNITCDVQASAHAWSNP